MPPIDLIVPQGAVVHEIPPTDFRIDRDRLAAHLSGVGNVTVILETGLGAESSEWLSVETDLRPFARILRYDRAGRGTSLSPVAPRTALEMVKDLAGALRAEKLAGPYLLVGHSFGGLLMRLFACLHPEEVYGLVLVDSIHPDQFERLGPLLPAPKVDDPQKLKSLRAFWQEGWRSEDATVERINFPESLAQDRAVRTLGDIPLHVIAAGTFTAEADLFGDPCDVLQSAWQTLQMDFLKLSSRSTFSLASESGHFVQRDNPERVSLAVRRMLAKE